MPTVQYLCGDSITGTAAWTILRSQYRQLSNFRSGQRRARRPDYTSAQFIYGVPTYYSPSAAFSQLAIPADGSSVLLPLWQHVVFGPGLQS